jgi:hypothetical protein
MAGRKRVSNSSIAAKAPHKKRARVAPSGSASQPISIGDTQQPSLSPSTLSTLSPPPPQASYVSTFESQLRDSHPEAEIVAPFEGSEEATVASSNTVDEASP